MNKEKRYIVTVGFSIEELDWRFCIHSDNVLYLDNIKDISNYKADILIINLDDYLGDLYDELKELEFYKEDNYHKHLYKKYDLYEYDRLNREKYKNYKKVYLVSIDCLFEEYNYKNNYSNIFFVNDQTKLDLSISNRNDEISNIKNKNINKLKEYVDNQKDYFNSNDIMKKFNVSNRWIKRYMKDMNDIYNNIGYSYSKRKWYKVYKG